MSETKKTPLNRVHRELKAKMVDFGGWDMPVQYSGIKEEHNAVRTGAGIFDVSHMGEIRIKGPDALAFVQKLVTGDMASAVVGDIKYAPMCYPDGGVVDDLLVYKEADDEYLLVVNASNTDKDFAWINENLENENVSVTNESDATGQIAIQGPMALGIAQKITDTDLSSVGYYKFVHGRAAGCDAILSRTGYTGEDGFEIYCQAGDTETVWQALMDAGEGKLVPCGLGCRDTLRFEAKMPLYGHEMSDSINPLETGLGRFVALDKGPFIGRDALAKMKEAGRPRKIVGFEMIGRGVPRDGYPIVKDGRTIGSVTSGTYAPYLEKNLGMAIVEVDSVEVGDAISVVIRDKEVEAQVVKTPFYKRA